MLQDRWFISTGIDTGEIPRVFRLCTNYPNPFNPNTKIKFDLPKSNLTLSGAKGLMVTLIIYDVLGREIETIINEQLIAGVYEVEWNAVDYPSGIYLYTLKVDGVNITKKMILVK